MVVEIKLCAVLNIGLVCCVRTVHDPKLWTTWTKVVDWFTVRVMMLASASLTQTWLKSSNWTQYSICWLLNCHSAPPPTVSYTSCAFLIIFPCSYVLSYLSVLQTRQPVFVQLLQGVFRVFHCNWLNSVQKASIEACIKVLSDVGKMLG